MNKAPMANEREDVNRIYTHYVSRIKFSDAPDTAAVLIASVLNRLGEAELQGAIDRYDEKVRSHAVNRVSPEVFFGDTAIYGEYLGAGPKALNADVTPSQAKDWVEFTCKNPACQKKFWDYQHKERRFCSNACSQNALTSPHVCPVCRKDFLGKLHQLYCDECKEKYTEGQLMKFSAPLPEKECPTCKKLFMPKTGKQVYCSVACRNSAREHTCQECGRVHRSKRRSRLYCSAACAYAARAREAREARDSQEKIVPGDEARIIYEMYAADFGESEDCDAVTIQIEKALLKYSAEALIAAMNDYEQQWDPQVIPLDAREFFGNLANTAQRFTFEAYLSDETLISAPGSVPKVITKTCPQCGMRFDTTPGPKKYCSRECASVANIKNIGYIHKKRRMAASNKETLSGTICQGEVVPATPVTVECPSPTKSNKTTKSQETPMPEKETKDAKALNKSFPRVLTTMEALMDEFVNAPLIDKVRFITILMPQLKAEDMTPIYQREYPEYLMPGLNAGDTVFHPYYGNIIIRMTVDDVYLRSVVDGKIIEFDRNGIIKDAPKAGRLIFTNRDEYNAHMDEKEAARQRQDSVSDAIKKSKGNA